MNLTQWATGVAPIFKHRAARSQRPTSGDLSAQFLRVPPAGQRRNRPSQSRSALLRYLIGRESLLLRERPVPAVRLLDGRSGQITARGLGRHPKATPEVEPPTFCFSGLRITMQDWPRRSPCLFSGMR